MADSPASPLRSPSMSPGPRTGRRRRFGPTLLLLAGVAAVVVGLAYRDRLRPAPASAAPRVERPMLDNTMALFGPLADLVTTPNVAAPAAAVPAAPTVAVPVIAAPPSVPPDAIPEPARQPAAIDPTRFRLQSIVIGRRGGTCLINGKPCRVGDEVNGATVKAIERGRVVLRIDREDVELRLAEARAGVAAVAPR